MKLKKFEKPLLAAAVTAALASMAGPAGAFTVTWDTVNQKSNADIEIWHAGASASTSSMEKAVVQGICDSTQPVDILEDARAVGKPSFWSVACIGKPGSGTLAGQKVLWSKRDDGGSGVGVGPLTFTTPGGLANPPHNRTDLAAYASPVKYQFIGFMMPSTGTGNNCPAVSGTRVIGSVTANIWNCTNFTYTAPVGATLGSAASIDDTNAASDAVLRTPLIGGSDIEPDKFSSAYSENVPAADFDLDGANGPALPPY